MNIVCAIDEGYAQHCGVMLCSLFSTNPGVQFRVFVVSDRLTGASRENLVHLAREWAQELVFVERNFEQFRSAYVSHHVTTGAYFRFVLPDVLPPDVEKALVLDADNIVRGRVAELYELPIDGYTHAAVTNPLCGVVHRRHPITLGIPEGSAYFNAGVMLVNVRRWREERISDRLIEYAATNAEKLRWWHQDVLNAVLHDRWKNCRPIWNAQSSFFGGKSAAELRMGADELLEVRASARIVHFCGTPKPWNYYAVHPFKSEYFKYLALTRWRGYRPVDLPPAWLRARSLVARIAPGFVKQGYRRLAGRSLEGNP